MALVSFPPVPVRLHWRPRQRGPVRLDVDGMAHPLRGVESVRDERAAWPADRGPRLTMVVATTAGDRAEIFFDPRMRSWYLDAWEDAA